jgi:hypothetical protein
MATKKLTQAQINAALFEAINKLTQKIDGMAVAKPEPASIDIKSTKKLSASKLPVKQSKTQIPDVSGDSDDDDDDDSDGRTKKTICRREPLQRGKKDNKFDKLPSFKNAAKEDIAIDKVLAGPISERSRGISLVKVRCNQCGKKETVSQKLVRYDEGEVRYKCGLCASGK